MKPANLEGMELRIKTPSGRRIVLRLADGEWLCVKPPSAEEPLGAAEESLAKCHFESGLAWLVAKSLERSLK